MFAVKSLDDTVARLRANGGELVGEVAQYEDMHRLCYMRGPAGIIVALAEELLKPEWKPHPNLTLSEASARAAKLGSPLG